MPVIDTIADLEPEMTAWRRHLHTIPELDFDLFETAAFVTARLREIGVDELHEGIATTGLVALIHGAGAGPVIGLRADMDALPIEEAGSAPWRSRKPGATHACGHDGHTAILLGAARHLADTRDFAGSVALIFQPRRRCRGARGSWSSRGSWSASPSAASSACTTSRAWRSAGSRRAPAR